MWLAGPSVGPSWGNKGSEAAQERERSADSTERKSGPVEKGATQELGQQAE